MKRTKKRSFQRTALRALTVEPLEARHLLATDLMQVGYFDTWNGAVPSSDPAGVAYHAPSGNLYISDSEINEIPAYQGFNVFEVDPSGSPLIREIDGNNSEPTGITYNEFDGYFYMTNDNTHEIARYDSTFNGQLLEVETTDDNSLADDPEGITADPNTGELYVVDGKDGGMQVLIYDADLVYQTSFSLSAYMDDAEGIAFNPDNGNLYIVSSADAAVFEITTAGSLVGEMDISGFSPIPLEPQGLTFAPTSDTSDSPDSLALYIADAMVDNFTDGRVFEAVLVAAPPSVDAGPDALIYEFNSAFLQGSVSAGASANWTQVSGPGSVAFVDPLSPTTTATFSSLGNYVLRLTGTEESESSFDDVEVTVIPTIEPGLQLVFAVQAGTELPGGLQITNEDLVFFDGTDFTLLFDGSDVSLGSERIAAFAVIDEDEILFSLTSATSIPGIPGTVDDSDIIKFTATQLGANTSGSFELYFDGSDVGLTEPSDDIDALELMENGQLLISTLGSPTITGISARDEDVLIFAPTSLGTTTAGSWDIYVDSGDIGLSSEDLNAVAIGPYDELYMSVESSFSLPEIGGNDEDVFVFKASTTGTDTVGAVASPVWFDGSAFGIASADIRGVDVVPSSVTDLALAMTVSCEWHLVFNKSTSLSSFTAANEDIVCFDGSGFSRYFDGSDVGLGSAVVDGISMLTPTEFLMSLNGTFNVMGIGSVEDRDIIKFNATALGDSTTGTFEMYFDGSDVGLDQNAEDIDAFDVLSDGRIILSTLGSVQVPGVSGGRDEDLLQFTPTSIGSNTSGTWEMYFDGSDVIDAAHDVDAVALDEGTSIFFSMFSAFSAGSISGADNDIAEFTSTQTGETTSGTWEQIIFDASSYGIGNSDLRAIDFAPNAMSESLGNPPVAPLHLRSIEVDSLEPLPTMVFTEASLTNETADHGHRSKMRRIERRQIFRDAQTLVEWTPLTDQVISELYGR